MPIARTFLLGAFALFVLQDSSAAAELQPRTVAAFDRYVRLAERQMDADERSADRFLYVDGRPADERRRLVEQARAGRLVIERLEPKDAGRSIDVPDGMVHHWVGAVFVPGATVDEAVGLLQDYDRHAQIYAPAVARSRIIARDGNRFEVFLRFFMKKVIAVTIDGTHVAQFTVPAEGRAASRIRSTQLSEVENAGTRSEKAKPPGTGHGFLWRLNTYWRFLERDGGVWVQCESITLTRDIPFGLGWIIGPFVTDIPKESLTFTLETTRKVLAGGRAPAR